MFILHGKVRKLNTIKTKEGKTLTKIFVEHLVSRGSADEADLRLEEIMIEPDRCQGIEEGKEAFFDLRPYPKGKDIGLSVAFAGLKISDLKIHS